MTSRDRNGWRAGAALLSAAALAGCGSISVPGLPGSAPAAETAAPTAPVAARPQPDANGVITYPNYQVAVARGGDTVADIAGRLNLDARSLADTNGLPVDSPLRPGELILLPSRVPVAAAAPQASAVDVAGIAGPALDRAEAQATGGATTSAAAPRSAAQEPQRHTVRRGESAYSIARTYNVSVRALADWNGLGDDLTVREGQVLLIPVATGPAPVATETVALPGTGSPAPVPPSAAGPQPDEDLPSAAESASETPTSGQDLAAAQTTASDTARMAQPVSGRIIRPFSPGDNDGVDFGATPGAPVRAAADGEVAVITTDTENTQIVVLRHPGGLLTVYANVSGVSVAQGARVGRGETIASVPSDPAFLHFEVRDGQDAVDPLDYIGQ